VYVVVSTNLEVIPAASKSIRESVLGARNIRTV
jgi:hypothetical protein